MSKAFTKEDTEAPDAEIEAPEIPSGGKNYISPAGFARLKAELRELVEVERPQVVKTVSWAASNGDRSENGDYIYGKKRLREIDRRGGLPIQPPPKARGGGGARRGPPPG